MQLPPTPNNLAVSMAPTAPDDPFLVVGAETPRPGVEEMVQDGRSTTPFQCVSLCLTTTLEIVLAADSDDGFECDANEWVVSPPHPSEFVRPPPVRPIFYVVTIGEEAGIYDSTW